MIYGIGVDAVRIDRMAKSLARPGFTARVFSEGERKLFATQNERRAAQTAAGCFAAKEAFLKSTGGGLGAFSLRDITALRDASGAPYFAFSGTAADFILKKSLAAHLSITNEAGLATAFVVLEAR